MTWAKDCTVVVRAVSIVSCNNIAKYGEAGGVAEPVT